MTEEEIIKEWKEVLSYAEHHELNLMDSVPTPLIRETVEMLERQQAEIEKLKDSRDRWKQLAKEFDKLSREDEKEIESLYAENEMLNNRLSKLQWSCDFELDYRKDLLKRAKAEAVKEFAEKLKEKLWSPTETWLTDDIVTKKQIDEVLEEMVGEANDR